MKNGYSGNPNTKYGRKKIRKEFWNKYHNEMSDDERNQNNNMTGCLIIVILVFIFIVVLIAQGPEEAIKYISK